MIVISIFLPLEALNNKQLLLLRATVGRLAISLLFQRHGIASVVALPRNDIFMSSKVRWG